jgi:hypothetical protein
MTKSSTTNLSIASGLRAFQTAVPNFSAILTEFIFNFYPDSRRPARHQSNRPSLGRGTWSAFATSIPHNSKPDGLLKEAQVIEAILKLNIDRCRWIAA